MDDEEEANSAGSIFFLLTRKHRIVVFVTAWLCTTTVGLLLVFLAKLTCDRYRRKPPTFTRHPMYDHTGAIIRRSSNSLDVEEADPRKPNKEVPLEGQPGIEAGEGLPELPPPARRLSPDRSWRTVKPPGDAGRTAGAGNVAESESELAPEADQRAPRRWRTIWGGSSSVDLRQWI